jgi:hypothetical protein
MKKIKMISQIWQDGYPPSRPRRHQLIEKLLMIPVILLRFLSADQVKSKFSEEASHNFMDYYVLVFAAILVAILSIPGHFGRVGGFVAPKLCTQFDLSDCAVSFGCHDLF